jgi:MFS family permease
MASETQPPRWNYRRRAIGAAVCLFPVALLVASLVVSTFLSKESGPVLALVRRVGLGVAVCALLPTALNVYIALRPTLYRWRHGSLEGFRSASVAPLAGTCCVLLAGLFGFGDWRVAVIGFFVLVFDVGGLPWFLIATWRDASFWDAP